jgi:hypothetical protein
MTHYAVIRRSGRAIPVTVQGRLVVYQHPLTPSDHGLRAMGLPFGHVRFFRRDDHRIRLMPRDWRPPPETIHDADRAPAGSEGSQVTRPV